MNSSKLHFEEDSVSGFRWCPHVQILRKHIERNMAHLTCNWWTMLHHGHWHPAVWFHIPFSFHQNISLNQEVKLSQLLPHDSMMRKVPLNRLAEEHMGQRIVRKVGVVHSITSSCWNHKRREFRLSHHSTRWSDFFLCRHHARIIVQLQHWTCCRCSMSLPAAVMSHSSIFIQIQVYSSNRLTIVETCHVISCLTWPVLQFGLHLL